MKIKVCKGFKIAEPTIAIDHLTEDELYRLRIYMAGYKSLNGDDSNNYEISYFDGNYKGDCYFVIRVHDRRSLLYDEEEDMSITKSYLDAKKMMVKLEIIYDQLMELLGKKGS